MYEIQFQLAWTDTSNNEDGFRVYRDGDPVADVAANDNDVIDSFTTRWGDKPFFYYVTAYNSVFAAIFYREARQNRQENH